MKLKKKGAGSEKANNRGLFRYMGVSGWTGDGIFA